MRLQLKLGYKQPQTSVCNQIALRISYLFTNWNDEAPQALHRQIQRQPLAPTLANTVQVRGCVATSYQLQVNVEILRGL